jgi:hypothetical protein
MLVLPFPPGGTFDPVLRALCNAAAQDLGQPIVLMHKPGGGGVTGTAGLATMAEHDGYTVAVMHNSVIRQPLLMKTAWDPLNDFTYLIGLACLPAWPSRPTPSGRACPNCSPTRRRGRVRSAGGMSARSASTASTPSGSPGRPARAST